MLRGVKLGGQAYKRVPRGVRLRPSAGGAPAPRGALRQRGVEASGAASGPGFVGWVADRLEQMAPVERWLTATLPWEA